MLASQGCQIYGILIILRCNIVCGIHFFINYFTIHFVHPVDDVCISRIRQQTTSTVYKENLKEKPYTDSSGKRGDLLYEQQWILDSFTYQSVCWFSIPKSGVLVYLILELQLMSKLFCKLMSYHRSPSVLSKSYNNTSQIIYAIIQHLVNDKTKCVRKS